MVRRSPIALTAPLEADAPEPGRMSAEGRRKQLIEVAMRLFSQKGFTGTTTKEIALAANVNEAIIFRHFATKDALYAAILDHKANEVCSVDWLEELREYAARRDDEGLFRLIAVKKFEHYRRDEHNNFMRLMFYSALEGHGLAHVFLERQARPVHDFLCDYIKKRQREGAFRRVHPGLAVSSFIGMLNHYMIMGAFFKNWKLDLTDKEAINSFTRLLLNGLQAGPAAPSLNKRSNSTRKQE